MSLTRPVLAVELNDGSEHICRINNVSQVAWDRTRAIRKWPTVTEAPSIWMTFITWHHLNALGVVSCTYEEYENSVCVAVGDPDPEEPDASADAVDPTLPAPGPDSATNWPSPTEEQPPTTG